MKFNDVLNTYLESLNCSSKKLSKESGLSEPTISRYRSGERTPAKDSNQFKKLINAIFNIAKENGKNKYSLDKITSDFVSTFENDNFDYETFSNNLNTLITSLKINMNEMAKYIVFDPSHISRIRYGKSKPSNPIEFTNKICSYILFKYKSPDDLNSLLEIIGCDKDITNEKIYDVLFTFLTSEKKILKNQISDFLHNLDTFNLDDYIKVIKFDKLKVPNIPFYKGKTKHYYGIEEMKEGELNFFKSTVLSKSKEDIFMCSDMPMEDMAEDISFGKKWMFGIAMCLKKGLHLNIIHNLDRPFNEMMLGLESWIPIYMTGSVSPYYLKNYSNNVYNHLNYTSGSVILTGECINSYHNKGKYYLTSNSKEINYYKEKTKLLLKKASPLMEIYTNDNKDAFNEFLKNEKNSKKDMKRLLANLPIFTIDDEILTKMLKRNKLTKDEIKLILNYKKNMENTTYNILKNNTIEDTIYNNDFNNDKPYLSLENMFFNKNIYYTKDEYLKHLNSTKKYCKSNNNYKLNIIDNKVFNNISITITNNYVIIYKNNNPQIKFVIKHSKLVDAISKFNPLVIEKN